MRTKKMFVRLVEEGMKKTGLSLRTVAREAGLDPSFLSKVLSLKRSPPSEEKCLKKLAEILEINPVLLSISTGMKFGPVWEEDRANFKNERSQNRNFPRKQKKVEYMTGTKELSEDLL
ncbi:MAG: helix-turn-helix transcriptional regulator [Elusimicrobia bacterium]|nr:helix-turn-helix transcriptional regulator [Elusimicrobiota bacterium]